MPTSARRVKALEKLIPLRCSTCGQEVRCDHCNDWKDEARALGIDPEVLVDRFRREIEAQLSAAPHDVFLSHGYDLSKLSVEELKTLRALLNKAGGEHAEETC